MIKIVDVAYILGLADEGQVTEGVKGEARAILKYFGVTGVEAEQTGPLKAGKVYDEAKVKRIAELRASF
jgi:hypothetical protein